MKIKVLVVDDSSIIRNIIKAIINEQPDMMVVGEAPDPLVARDLIRSLNPDVLTLDIEMPNMNGLSFLKRLMRLKPMPVVMLSSHTHEGSDVAFRALAMGAIDFIGKPLAGEVNSGDYARAIGEKIRAAYEARDKIEPLDLERAVDAEEVLPMLAGAPPASSIIALAASTSGAEAVRTVICALPRNAPAVLVTTDMQPNFVKHFVRRLGESSQLAVTEGTHGEPILPGHVYLAPGGQHMRIANFGTRGLGIELGDDEPINGRRPSADALFFSMAEHAPRESAGVVLAGMGNDGAKGLLALRQAGGRTLAQDEASCMVFAMPEAAIAMGAADVGTPLDAIANLLMQPRDA
jgi:two-component system chemotaxis response regulator CheB